jgi:hypothetical protein
VATTIYVQPATAGFGDVPLLSETSLVFKVSKISSRPARSVRYDSERPTAVLPLDTELEPPLLTL